MCQGRVFTPLSDGLFSTSTFGQERRYGLGDEPGGVDGRPGLGAFAGVAAGAVAGTVAGTIEKVGFGSGIEGLGFFAADLTPERSPSCSCVLLALKVKSTPVS